MDHRDDDGKRVSNVNRSHMALRPQCLSNTHTHTHISRCASGGGCVSEPGARGDSRTNYPDDNVSVKRTRSSDQSHIVHPGIYGTGSAVPISLAAGITYDAKIRASLAGSFGLLLRVSLSPARFCHAFTTRARQQRRPFAAPSFVNTRYNMINIWEIIFSVVV